MNGFSKSRIDRLGDQLRSGRVIDADLRLLDDYRRSFADPYQTVITSLRKAGTFEPTGRPEKSTPAIVEKLKRQSVRLSQIQDIAGCRIVVEDVARQHVVVQELGELFPTAKLVDRLNFPSHGYMAAHLIVDAAGRPIEIQIRSPLQHAWAELSEKLADTIDPSLKYGGGPALHRDLLSRHSEAIRELESHEIVSLIEIALEKSGYRPAGAPAEGRLDALIRQYERLVEAKNDLLAALRRLTDDAGKGKGE